MIGVRLFNSKQILVICKILGRCDPSIDQSDVLYKFLKEGTIDVPE
jgi:hypothetical protein